ncbi:prefoldin subunit [Pyrenophora seminiperda CCB06]|uniref:Prefoldin subunit n=1 Tax=Pyrenophora seminiperda CCB06 TaxID=1302712 RepID=A0A3M7M7T3_9PLEO|nr:prefoldin subunit [Pyrenophora seminiperda CCB06]
MPSILSLSATGSPYSTVQSVTRLLIHLVQGPNNLVYWHQKREYSLISACSLYGFLPLSPTNYPTTSGTLSGIALHHHEKPQRSRRLYSVQHPKRENFPGPFVDNSVSFLKADATSEVEPTLWDMIEGSEENPGEDPENGLQEEDPLNIARLSRNARKALRQSRPATVLASISGPAKHLYFTAPANKIDLSYNSVQRSACSETSQVGSPFTTALQALEPHSLYSILGRYLQHHTTSPLPKQDFEFTSLELHFLRSRGYSPEIIERWASSLTEPYSNVATRIFEPEAETPPRFLLLLFLRRKQIRVFALRIIMGHLDRIVQSESLSWSELKIITVRLVRHARELWPESLPWIASWFVTEARRLHRGVNAGKQISPQRLSDITQFCNGCLMLLALPASSRPVVYATHQENAQFKILQYMASTSPAIVVSRLGFRSVIRNQLAHAKTLQEREWAVLKGPSWPPWKENRTAMDEEKGYEFGASRASQLLRRMYEAGYASSTWEDVAQIYAGWDTDLSPTIQTRTSLPRFSSQYRHDDQLRAMIWAGRIRTTRTRREAWACFLSSEESGEPAHAEIYRAMFEKLAFSTVERSDHADFSSNSGQPSGGDSADLLPGDMKEVLPDPSSSLHNVYISEPIPEYRQLLGRMLKKQVKPSNRLLAFLLEWCPDFHTGLDLLKIAKDHYNGGIGRILKGIHDDDASVRSIPGYLFASIIRFLCGYGQFAHPPAKELCFLSPEQHANEILWNRQYLIEYAYMLLRYYRPKYRPAWTTFTEKVVGDNTSKRAGKPARYRIISGLLDDMEEIDLDIDDELFRVACTATCFAAQTVNEGGAAIEDARHIFTIGSARLRALFNTLVGTDANMHSHTGDVVPPHIPGPAELHAYVRALSILADYEGLCFFTAWLIKQRSGVTARAEAQRSGRDTLFRTLVALRLAVEGGGLHSASKYSKRAPENVALLIRSQIEGVEEWGGWPAQEYVELYIKKKLKARAPTVGGR